MLTFVLTRHGLTDRSEPEQYLGQRIDAALTAAGRAAALALAERLRGVTFERVISSPLERALATARLLSSDAVETDDRLMEADYGDWEGHTVEEIEARWPDVRRSWEADPATCSPPSGETGQDVALRARSLIGELIEWADERGPGDHRVLIVGHSTLNRILLAVSLGVPLRDYRRRFRQDWASLTVLRFDAANGARLLLYNDRAHIVGTTGATWE